MVIELQVLLAELHAPRLDTAQLAEVFERYGIHQIIIDSFARGALTKYLISAIQGAPLLADSLAQLARDIAKFPIEAGFICGCVCGSGSPDDDCDCNVLFRFENGQLLMPASSP